MHKGLTKILTFVPSEKMMSECAHHWVSSMKSGVRISLKFVTQDSAFLHREILGDQGL